MNNFTKTIARILRHINYGRGTKMIVSLVIGFVSCMAMLCYTTSDSNQVGNMHAARTVAEGVDLVIAEVTTAQGTSTIATTCTTRAIVTTTSGITTTSTMSTTDTTSATTITDTETMETTTSTDQTTTVDITTTEVAETIVEETTTTEQPREYVVYKPSTHYIHRNTCRWFNSECYEIENTEGLECRRCSECDPDMDILTEYVVPTVTQEAAPVQNNSGYTSLNYITEEERIYLCNTVGAEYGSDWVPLYDKACVVATVMNRVYDGGWTNGNPSTIYNVLTAPYQYNPAYATPSYRYNVTQSCIDAVEYYFEHQSDFPHYTSFWGDGTYNHFR